MGEQLAVADAGAGAGAGVKPEFENSTSIPSSSLTEKNCTRSVREGAGDSTSPSIEENVGDSGSWSTSGDNSPGNGSDCSAIWKEEIESEAAMDKAG